MSDTTENNPALRKVDLDHGLKRGETTITSLHVRKPGGGELRGLSQVDVLRQDYNTISKLASRACIPPITEAEYASLDPADMMLIGSEFAAFFISRQQKADSGLDA